MTEKLLRIRDVCEMVGFGQTIVYEWVKDGIFPEPIRVHGKNSQRWLQSEVQQWIQDQVASNREAA